jgi:hypothetical protein
MRPRDLQTLAILAALAAALNLLCVIAYSFGQSSLPMLFTYNSVGLLMFCVICLGAFFIFFGSLVWRREHNPLDATRAWLADNIRSVVFAAIAIQILSFALAGFTALKEGIGNSVPFYADHALAWVDQPLRDLWNDSFTGGLISIIDPIYVRWVLVQSTFATVVALSSKPARDRILVAYILTWIFSLAFGYLFASAGPIFYDQLYSSNAYSGLVDALRGTNTRVVADYLLSHGSGIGKGISAMPSMHIAGCVWMVIATRRLWPAFTPLAIAYLCVIAVGAVMLGWHYTLDVVAGALVAWLAWSAAEVLQMIVQQTENGELPVFTPELHALPSVARNQSDS